jgi:CRISPR-associated endonuclease/helicase Cas3
VTEQPDGYLLWQANIAEPQEMLPWIRGWGADCEVLGPKELRHELVRETKQLMRVYQLENHSLISEDDENYDQFRANQLFRE